MNLAVGKEIIEPEPWPQDGGARREPVLDPNWHPPRVIRRVGWARCLTCRDWFFSTDVCKVRLCRTCRYGAEADHPHW
jgi:hypothetical protein